MPRKVWEVSHRNHIVPVTLGGRGSHGPRFPEEEVQGHCQGGLELGLPSLALRFPIPPKPSLGSAEMPLGGLLPDRFPRLCVRIVAHSFIHSAQIPPI